MERIFRKHTNKQLERNNSMTVYTAENEDIQLSYEEVTHVIQCLKKTQGSRNRSNSGRILKKGEDTLWRRIHHLVKLIWTQHNIPEDWSIGII